MTLTTQTLSLQDSQAPKRAAPFTRPSSYGAPIALSITPIYNTNDSLRYYAPAQSLSAQLLELGLRHQVDGLIQKAQDQLDYAGTTNPPSSPQAKAAYHYERAQDNFSRDSLHVVEVVY